MGISGLQTFINDFFTEWKREIVRGKMVIAGNQLCHQLYHPQFEGGVCLDWIHGGQYREYRAVVVEFFHYLQQAGITPTVVFDGVFHKNDKFHVVYDRYRRRASHRHKVLSRMPHSLPRDNSNATLPPLAYRVLHATLQELGVEQIVAEGDGDAMIACMANQLNCPVLSKDSDFFMTRLPRGYIPLDRFMRDTCSKPIPITTEVFHVSEFNRQFQLRPDNDLHLVIPAVMGNDYLQRPPKVLTQILSGRVSSDESRFMCLLRYLKQFESFEDFLASIPQVHGQGAPEIHAASKDTQAKQANSEDRPEEQENDTDTYEEQANVDERNGMGKVNGDDIPVNGKGIHQKLRNNYQQAVEMYNNVQKCKSNALVAEYSIPHWLAEKYHCGKFLRYLLQARFLGFQLSGSTEASKLLRQYAYSLLGVGTEFVREYPATSGTVKEVSVEALHSIQGSPSRHLPKLSEVEYLSLNDRQQLLYQMLCCDPVQIETLEEKWKLVIASVVFWAKVTQPTKEIVQALLVCFLLCSEASTTHHQLPPHGTDNWLETQSAFIAWQSTYLDSDGLNQLMMEPLQSPSAAFLFDGKLAISLAAEPNIDDRVTEFGINHDLYQRLLDVVLSQYEVPSESWKMVKKAPKSTIKSATKPPLDRQSYSYRTGNSKETVPQQKRMMSVPLTHNQRSERRAEPTSRGTHHYETAFQQGPGFDTRKSQPTEKPNDMAVPQRRKVTLVPYTNSLGAEATTGEEQSHKQVQLSDRQSRRHGFGDRPRGSTTQRRTLLQPTQCHRAGRKPEATQGKPQLKSGREKQSSASQTKECVPKNRFELLPDNCDN